jgi:polyhydroxybutyrate depolymerase
MAHRLACELPDKIAAIAAVAGAMAPEVAERCEPGRPVSVLAIHGTADRLVKSGDEDESGDEQPGSVAATVKKWVELNGCPAAPATAKLGEDVTRETFAPCREGTEVTLYRIAEGGHTWPGGPQYLPRVIVGETNRELSASEVIWAFFERHPMK